MISVCNVKNCESDFRVWKITNNNESPPFYQEFNLCESHLYLDQRYEEIHKSLVQGRLYYQCHNSVSYGGWNFEKIVTTWGKTENRSIKCDDCSTAEKIWIVVKPITSESKESDSNEGDDDYIEYETKLFCNEHLVRWDYPKDQKIRSWNSDVGISTVEETWTQEQFIDEPEGGCDLATKRPPQQAINNNSVLKKNKMDYM